MHETAEEAIAETERMLEVYADFCENQLAMPVVKGQKTESEKFAGAEATYTIEAMMHDGKALQSGTSHYFGNGFAKAFNVTFQGRDNSICHPYQTSWGMSTRIIGGIIMTHGDNDGLVLPPAIAPVQVIIIPVAQHKPGVLEKANEVAAQLKKRFRVKMDDSSQTPGWKFAQYEMKGVPLRLEIGPRDIAKGQCVLVRRTDRQKISVPLAGVGDAVAEQLQTVRQQMYDRALQRRENMTYEARTLDEMKQIADAKPGLVKAMWCGDAACEAKIKEVTGLSSRCIPFEQEHLSDACVCCGRPAAKMVYWGKAY